MEISIWLQSILVGIGATLIMDSWSWWQKTYFIIQLLTMHLWDVILFTEVSWFISLLWQPHLLKDKPFWVGFCIILSVLLLL